MWTRSWRIWLVVASGHFWRARANMPATSGVAYEVPLTVVGALVVGSTELIGPPNAAVTTPSAVAVMGVPVSAAISMP